MIEGRGNADSEMVLNVRRNRTLRKATGSSKTEGFLADIKSRLSKLSYVENPVGGNLGNIYTGARFRVFSVLGEYICFRAKINRENVKNSKKEN